VAILTVAQQEILVTTEAIDLLEAWERLATGGAYSVESLSAYRSDWQRFSAWCQTAGHLPMPANPETVAAYLRCESEQGRALATLKRRAATVSLAHCAARLPEPCKTEPVRLTLRALAGQKGTQQKQAPGLNQRDADRIMASMEGTRPKDLRDLALLLVGRDLLARASELVSITVEAITWDGDGTAQVALMRSKTSTETIPY
jgi:site-specific recombinase XerD